MVPSETNSFSVRLPQLTQVYIECVLHFSLHKKDMLPRVCPSMTGLAAKTVLRMTINKAATGAGYILGWCAWVCNNSSSPCRPGPRHAPSRPSCKFLGPNVSVSLRPTTSFIMYNLVPSPLYCYLFCSCDIDHLLTHYINYCIPPPPL